MDFAPYARILLRYLIGYLAGSEIGAQLALDQDVVAAVAIGMAAAVEAFYALARRKGWAT